jgi:transposase
VPVSTVCEEAGIQPSLFYQWQKQFFENGAAAFQSSRPKTDPAQQRLATLENKLRKKDEVLAELMEEHVALKKSLGEL